MELMTQTELFAYKVRYYLTDMISHLGFGHIGGSLSVVDVLSVLYAPEEGIMKIDPKNPKKEDRDYFVLSKGHAGPALYATLAIRGYFDLKELHSLNQIHTTLPSHVDRLKTLGVDMTAGSLGQGLGAAVGIALGARQLKKGQKVFCIVGDGELNEGQCWEAIQVAAHQKLNNLIVFVDDNKKQLDGLCNHINKSFDFVKKFDAFGWNAVRVNGHDYTELHTAIAQSKSSNAPLAIIMDTVKGKGISFLEQIDDHHLRIDSDEKKKSLQEALKLFKEKANI
ncbi:MAG: transketolase [Brevinema sp.]